MASMDSRRARGRSGLPQDHPERGAALQAHRRRAARLQPAAGTASARRCSVNMSSSATLFLLKHHARFKQLIGARGARPQRAAAMLCERGAAHPGVHGAAHQRGRRDAEYGNVSVRTRPATRGTRGVVIEVEDEGIRHDAQRSRTHLRAVLHNQGAGPRHGPRARDMPRRSWRIMAAESKSQRTGQGYALHGSCSRWSEA